MGNRSARMSDSVAFSRVELTLEQVTYMKQGLWSLEHHNFTVIHMQTTTIEDTLRFLKKISFGNTYLLLQT